MISPDIVERRRLYNGGERIPATRSAIDDAYRHDMGFADVGEPAAARMYRVLPRSSFVRHSEEANGEDDVDTMDAKYGARRRRLKDAVKRLEAGAAER